MKLLLVLCMFFLLFSSAVQSQVKNYPDSINHKRLKTTIGVGVGSYAVGLSFLGLIWYKDQERVPFHLYNDSKGYLQMDKAGHAFGAYVESSVAYHALRQAGLNKKKALIYGGSAGLIFQTPIEVFDGIYEGWGFSWYDMAANTFGALLFTAQEAWFNEQIVRMKFSYSPSEYPKYHTTLGESNLESFFLDYNAHTYWLSANLTQISAQEAIPEWINIAVGYSANGMIKEFENPSFYRGEPFPHLDRYRQYLISLDVDFSKIKTNKIWLRKVFRAVNLLKIPFPAVEINNVEGVRWRNFYF